MLSAKFKPFTIQKIEQHNMNRKKNITSMTLFTCLPPKTDKLSHVFKFYRCRLLTFWRLLKVSVWVSVARSKDLASFWWHFAPTFSQPAVSWEWYYLVLFLFYSSIFHTELRSNHQANITEEIAHYFQKLSVTYHNLDQTIIPIHDIFATIFMEFTLLHLLL